MEVVLTYISNALFVLGAVVAFFGIFCLVTLNAKPKGKNKEQLEQLSVEQIAKAKKNAKQSFSYMIVAGVVILVISFVLKSFAAKMLGA